MNKHALRRRFAAALYAGLHVVWPILSGLVGVIVAFGLVVFRVEGWSLAEPICFAFVSALTIGYGDLAPKSLVAGSSRSSLGCAACC